MELASVQEKLKGEGWNLSNNGAELISENGKITDKRTLINRAIDVDLKTISQGTLPEDLNRTKYEQIPGNIVLQIQKIKNLSSPKSYEAKYNPNTSILKLNLTDGVQNVQAIPMDQIGNIHMNTYPGSKIHITGENINICHGFLLLFNSNTHFLGGKVENLIEKWELNKRLAKHTRDRLEEGGPPPWIGFGQKIIKHNGPDKNFKSLELAKNKEAAENSEFEAQRKGAILEATKIGCTKVFGGGNNKLLDYNVQQIIDAGFSMEDAEYALKISKNNLDRALRNLQNKYNKSNKDDNSKSNSKSGGNEEKKGKNRNRHRDDDAGPSLKPSGKVSLFEFLEDKLPFSEPPIETKPQDKRNGNAFKTNNRANQKGNSDRGKFSYEEKRNSEKIEKGQKKGYESSKPFSKFDLAEKRNYSEKRSEFGKFEIKKGMEGGSRTDKSFGNFKARHELKNGDYGSRNEFFKGKPSEKRGTGGVGQSAIKSHGRPMDFNETKKSMVFSQSNEKPPRFQKYQSQQAENQVGGQNWNDHGFNRMTQSEFQLQNSIANLTLQQNIANFQNQNSQDGFGDVLTGVPASSPKPNNLFYQNLVIPTSQSGDNRLCGNQSAHPPPQQSHMNTFGSRNVGGFIQQEVKSSSFSNMPNLQDVAFKNNGPLLHGYNDFQSVFGNSRTPSTSFTNTQYISGPNGIAPQSHKTWIWSKGDKCMARYWEDQMYYNAVVTAVSDNTCVVRFTDYGNYEEVLQDHCIPITEES
ncbi:hypothetical protein RUM44_002418 [Polyplax serrata]|uniref:Tudor domain-containing protein 3 n=1 Tax=Polyplax serrata TaxID=468196 RepID=A0ABR1AEQ7_POLSC